MSTTGRVPAWKKLGLRLKYAKDVPLDDGQTQNEIEGLNGEGEKEKENKQGEGKKRRFDEEEEEEGSTSKSKKKKRVSFTADTKALDGEGEDTDQEPGEVPASGEDGEKKKDGGVSGQQSIEEDGDDERSGSEVKEKKKKKKEKGQKKDTTISMDSSPSTPHIHETPILSYLNLYYKNRPAWKFQKNRETHLFKHILSLEQVPAQYNAALLAYLQGLKSEGAKQRLCQTSEEVVKAEIEEKTPENGDTAAEEKEEGNSPDATDYQKAVDAFRSWLLDPKEDFDNSSVSEQFDDDIRKKLEKRQRAELMYFAVQGKLFSVEKPKPAEKEARPKKLTPGQKKRKNRTAIIEISSSSESESSSSSSSDSDSDSSDSEDEKPGKSTSKSESKPASKSSSDSDTSSDTSSDSDNDSESTSSSGSSSSSSS